MNEECFLNRISTYINQPDLVMCRSSFGLIRNPGCNRCHRPSKVRHAWLRWAGLNDRPIFLKLFSTAGRSEVSWHSDIGGAKLSQRSSSTARRTLSCFHRPLPIITYWRTSCWRAWQQHGSHFLLQTLWQQALIPPSTHLMWLIAHTWRANDKT